MKLFFLGMLMFLIVGCGPEGLDDIKTEHSSYSVELTHFILDGCTGSFDVSDPILRDLFGKISNFELDRKNIGVTLMTIEPNNDNKYNVTIYNRKSRETYVIMDIKMVDGSWSSDSGSIRVFSAELR